MRSLERQPTVRKEHKNNGQQFTEMIDAVEFLKKPFEEGGDDNFLKTWDETYEYRKTIMSVEMTPQQLFETFLSYRLNIGVKMVSFYFFSSLPKTVVSNRQVHFYSSLFIKFFKFVRTTRLTF